MCHGKENRLFVDAGHCNILELDTSTTTFTKVKAISTGASLIVNSLCYVPDPHRLLVVSYYNGFRAMSCDDNKEAWRVQSDDLPAGNLTYTPTHESIIVADGSRNKVVILSPSIGSQLQSVQLPDYMCYIRGLYVYNDRIVVRSEGRISYFSLM